MKPPVAEMPDEHTHVFLGTGHAMIDVLIGYEAIVRFLSPVPIRFAEAIPIAVVGLMVNIVSAWLLSGSDHHGHDHGHGHGHGENHSDHEHGSEHKEIATAQGL